MFVVNDYGLAEVTQIAPEVLALFSCGKSHLDNFLHARAEFMHSEHLSTVWVVMRQDLPYPAAYFTLHNDSLTLTDSEETDLGLKDHAGLTRFPAIVIGRLALDQRLHGTPASSAVMQLVFNTIQKIVLQRHSAARLLVVDADNDPKVLRFYKRNGFESSIWADKQAANQTRGARTTVKMLRDILTT